MSAPTSPRRTVIGLSDANCGWCLADATNYLLADEDVTAVHLHQAAGCLVVDHCGDTDALLRGLTTHLRGWTRADNGEAVMVSLTAQEEPRCRWPTTPTT